METENKFTMGQTVVVTSRGHGEGWLATVVKVWKNGVFELEGSDPFYSFRGVTFSPDGRSRGTDSFSRKYVRPLEDGETVESILFAKDDAAAKAKADKEQKEQERRVAVAQWWEESGKDMWDNRQQLGEFMGEQVAVIRYEDREQRMPMVIVRKRKSWNDKEELEAIVGGLSGHSWQTDEVEKTSVSTYSQSTVTGKTLEEVLYNVTH